MALSDRKLEKLRQRVRVHLNWFVAAILGEEALTAEEREELKKFKKLPAQSLGLVEKAYILGRLKSILKKGEWSKLNWEDLLEKAEKPSLTPLEKFALRQAKLRAAQYVKGLAEDISQGVFQELSKQTQKVVTEASVKEIISDEVQLGLLEKKHYKEVASKLASRTKTKYGRDWEKISRTEMHAAKMQGLAQAIINKINIYKNSKGVDSDVSVVPHPGTCPDCAKHFLDTSGNPIVFSLRNLLNEGSNGDPGVDHSKVKNVHPHWKTTLPPLHPNCRCELVFIPPGFGWVDGKLVVVDRSKLSKAIGDSKLSATAKSPGPATAAESAKPANPPSIPGVKSPAQKVASGIPGVSGGSASKTSDAKQMEPCPFGGGEDCRSHDGDGAKSHEAGGSIDKAHKQAISNGAVPKDPEAAAALRQKQTQEAISWGKQEHPHATKLNHLGKGKFTSVEKLSGSTEGVAEGSTEAYRVTIEGNGRGVMKPAPTNHTGDLHGESTTVPGTAHHREESSYSLSMAFGLTDHVPPTSTRFHESRAASVQEWKEDYSPLGTTLIGSGDPDVSKNCVTDFLDKVPDHKKDHIKNKLSELAVMQLMTNHGDAHDDNLLVNKDFTNVVQIDNTAAFGNMLDGCSSQIHHNMHSAGMKLKVPDHLMDKFEKTTYHDLKRSMPKLSNREVAQTYYRMKYLHHLQKTEGHLDYNRFKPASYTVASSAIEPRWQLWQKDLGSTIKEFKDRLSDQTLPSDQFREFVGDYLRDVFSNSATHPDFESLDAISNDEEDDNFMPSSEDFYNEQVVPNNKNAPVVKPPAPTPTKTAVAKPQQPQATGPKTAVAKPKAAKPQEPKTAVQRPKRNNPPIEKSLFLRDPTKHFPLDS